MYELLYLIYFYIDDYETASNFWLLNKTFTTYYMNAYNTNYVHKFKLLTNNLDNTIKAVSNENQLICKKYEDINLKFSYKLYKKALIKDFIKCDFDYNRKCSWCQLMIYCVLHDGIDTLNKIYDIKCDKNKVRLICKINKKQDLMEFLSYFNKLNIYCIKLFKENVDNALE